MGLEEKRYVLWFKEAVKNKGLLFVNFYIGREGFSDRESFFKELNLFNSQFDSKETFARIEVRF